MALFINMDDIRLFVPFEKKDDDERIVEGYATSEALDSQGEIVKLTAVEKALPDYMKFANIREMHQWSAVGKAVETRIDDDKKALFLKAKIVGQEAWEKCKEGVYNGFSIGGKITKKIGNVIEDLVLNEISLVDRPANPQAVFSLVKMQDGKVVEDEMTKLEKDLKKVLPIAPDGMEEADPEEGHKGVFTADTLVAMAANIAYMVGRAKTNGRKYKHLEKVLESLKSAAMQELQIDKAEESEKLESEQAETIKGLKSAKSYLERLIKSKDIQENWSDGYFEQLKKSL